MSTILLFGMRVLEVLFFVGIAGSAIVVAIATGEDIGELIRKDDDQVLEKTPSA